MKKVLQILTGVLSVTLLYTAPLYATETVEMYMDDHKVIMYLIVKVSTTWMCYHK